MAKTPVFLSWSGEVSRGVAEQFANYLPRVVQAVQPFFSPKDIEKGAQWYEKIKLALEASRGVGVFFLTRENLASRWLNFEAGAIASFPQARVCTFLIDLEQGEVGYPLDAFQSTKFEEADILQLCKDINDCTEQPVAPHILQETFKLIWQQQLHDALARVLKAAPKPAAASPAQSVSSDELDRAALTRIENGLAAINQRLDRLYGVGHIEPYDVDWAGAAIQRPSKSGMLFKTLTEDAAYKDAAYKLLVEGLANKEKTNLLVEALRKGKKKRDEDPEPTS